MEGFQLFACLRNSFLSKCISGVEAKADQQFIISEANACDDHIPNALIEM